MLLLKYGAGLAGVDTLIMGRCTANLGNFIVITPFQCFPGFVREVSHASTIVVSSLGLKVWVILLSSSTSSITSFFAPLRLMMPMRFLLTLPNAPSNERRYVRAVPLAYTMAPLLSRSGRLNRALKLGSDTTVPSTVCRVFWLLTNGLRAIVLPLSLVVIWLMLHSMALCPRFALDLHLICAAQTIMI